MSGIPSLGGYSEALQYARESARELFGQIPLKHWKSTTVPEYFIDMHPEIEAVQANGPETQYYVVSNRLALSISVLADSDPNFFEIASMICAANVFNGQPVPKSLRPFAFRVLIGEQKTQSRSGRKAGENFLLKMLMRKLAMDLVELFGVDLAHGDDKWGGSACGIVQQVAAEHGYNVACSTVIGWCQNPKQAAFREQADNLYGLMLDKYLIKLGALGRRL